MDRYFRTSSSETGNDFEIPILKTLKKNNVWKSQNAGVAISKVQKHTDKLECYACYATLAPQCYGCHVQMNYSKDENGRPHQDTDWIASANQRAKDGGIAESPLGTKGIQSIGNAIETRSCLRWEEPVLGI